MIGRMLAWPFKILALLLMALAVMCDGAPDETMGAYIKRTLWWI